MLRFALTPAKKRIPFSPRLRPQPQEREIGWAFLMLRFALTLNPSPPGEGEPSDGSDWRYFLVSESAVVRICGIKASDIAQRQCSGEGEWSCAFLMLRFALTLNPSPPGRGRPQLS